MRPSNEQIHECFNCEKWFTVQAAISAIVPMGYETQYCSLDCYVEFENELKAARIPDSEFGAISNNEELAKPSPQSTYASKAPTEATEASAQLQELTDKILGKYRINKL